METDEKPEVKKEDEPAKENKEDNKDEKKAEAEKEKKPETPADKIIKVWDHLTIDKNGFATLNSQNQRLSKSMITIEQIILSISNQ